MVVYSLLCKMLPDREGKIRLRLHHQLFNTEEEAAAVLVNFRRQNLPFTSTIVSFTIPDTLSEYIE